MSLLLSLSAHFPLPLSVSEEAPPLLLRRTAGLRARMLSSAVLGVHSVDLLTRLPSSSQSVVSTYSFSGPSATSKVPRMHQHSFTRNSAELTRSPPTSETSQSAPQHPSRKAKHLKWCPPFRLSKFVISYSPRRNFSQLPLLNKKEPKIRYRYI